MSFTTVAAQQNATQTSAASGTSATSAMGSLSGNFQSFLKLLMTQLQNQDPTSPMDTDQFTSQLVQFAGVEQQINANTNLTQLISLTQSGQMMQASAMVGRSVMLDVDHVPLQNGSGSLSFTTSAAGPAEITLWTDAGALVRDVTVNAAQGANSWTWDGRDLHGNKLPDGSYKAVVTGVGPDGTATALPFTVSGTVTGVQKNGSSMQLLLRAHSVDFSAVQSVAN